MLLIFFSKCWPPQTTETHKLLGQAVCSPGRRGEQEVQRRGAGAAAVLGLFPKDFCSLGGHNQPPAQDHHSPAAAQSAPPGFKTTWTHLPSRNGAPLGRSLLGSVVCGGLGFTPTPHVLCPAPHKPTLQDKGPENPLLNGFPSAPGQKGYLADFAMEGNISQALKKLRL